MDTASTPIKFDIYEGNQLVRTEILAEQTIKIGKLSSSHVRIDDDSVSRMHAVIEASSPDDVVILDLGSTTGTYVNGERVTKQRLRTGDRIRFGNTTVIVAIAGQSGQGGAANRRPVVSNAPLFDEDEGQAGGRRALEILVMWGVTVVDVQHFTEPGSYTIGDGDEASHFVKPQLIPQNPFPLAETDGSTMVVNVPEGVEGEVMLDGKVYALEELKNAGKLGRSSVPRSHSLSLPPRARCRLKFGELTFLINSVPAAPPVGRGSFLKAMDPQLLRYLLAAAVLHALFFLIVLSIPEDADSLSMDGFDMSDRFVDFMFKPEDEQQKVEDLFGDMKEEGEKAEKAKEDQGEMGDRTEEAENKRFAIEGNQEEIELARERAKQEAIDTAQAAINSLEGELSSVWGEGNQAIGSDAVSALGNMFGDKTGAAAGFGGLGVAGAGRGGGGFGDASIGVGNVGTKGRGGGGNSGYGRGQSRLGRKSGKQPKVIPGNPIVQGSLDRETIRRVIRRHRAEYRYCYERELNRKRDLNGKIKVKFTIAGNGSVIASQVVESTMKNAGVENCLAAKIKRWVFPAPKGGGIVIVTYPFIFKPS